MAKGTYSYGKLFETLVVNEVAKLNSYYKKNYSISYLRTKSGAEIDLVIERPGCPTALVEIKSTTKTDKFELQNLRSLSKNIENSELFCLSQDPVEQRIDSINYLPWNRGLEELGLTSNSFT